MAQPDRIVDQRLARQGYTAEQVDGWLRQSGLRHSVRYDLLDTSVGQPFDFGQLSQAPAPVIGTVDTVISESNPTVTVNAEQKITGTLKLQMYPDERLADRDLQWSIRPVYLLEIPNGDRLEFNCGVYPYVSPERTLDPRMELWDIQLGDNSYWMDTQSVLFGGWSVTAGEPYTERLKWLYIVAGIFDFSGIEDEPTAPDHDLLWGYDRPPEFVWYGLWFWHWNNSANQAQIKTTTMADIAMDMNAAIGHYPPFFDRDGRPRSKAYHDLRATDPIAQFGTAKDSITFRDMTTKSDRSKIANFVFVYTENPEGSTFVATADANQYWPNHPWAMNKIGHYITRSEANPFVTGPLEAEYYAQRLLAASLTYNQTISYETMAHPTLEVFDVNKLYVQGDRELDTPTPYIKVGYSFDLHAGRMKHTDRRIVIPPDIDLADVGLTESKNAWEV